MVTTNQYLDHVKKRHSLKSDYALSKFLRTSTAAITQYRKKLFVMDDDMALKVAEALELNPLEVIAVANSERAKDEEKRERWLNVAKRAA